jgi:hypothetical protein
MLHDYLSKAKSFKFHYFVLSIGTVRGNPITVSDRSRKSDASSLIQYYTLARLITLSHDGILTNRVLPANRGAL